MVASYSIIGPDVSSYQNVNWSLVKTPFAFCKATEGSHTVDLSFNKNWKGIKSAGIKVRGAYHYGHLENDPVKDAVNFWKTIQGAGGVGPGDLLALDMEDTTAANAANIVNWCGKFLEEIKILSGLPDSRILIYTGQWWWGPRTNSSSKFSAHPLWVSSYPRLIMVGGWKNWAFHQFSDKYAFDGIGKCDASLFNGTQEQLHSLAGIRKPVSDRIQPIKIHMIPGGKGPGVRDLQKVLKANGFYHSEITNYYGLKTRRAVKEFHLKYPQFASKPLNAIGPKGWRFLQKRIGRI